MSSSNPHPVCPHCGSTKVTFLEHGSGVIVFRCENCARATIQRWTAHAAAPARGDAIARDVNMGEVVEVEALSGNSRRETAQKGWLRQGDADAGVTIADAGQRRR